MPLIDEMKLLCDRLAPLGWRQLFLELTAGALDIAQPTSSALQSQLTQTLANIDRSHPGFEDFSAQAERAVEAGEPSKSLLYHALASPLVTRDRKGMLLKGFATPRELDVVENFVFCLSAFDLTRWLAQAGSTAKAAIVLFCSEYRPAKDSVDGRHADLTFSRTGIARVGTSRPRYNPATRGFWPEDENNPHGFRVVPARFTPWLAVKKKGKHVRVSPIQDNAEGQLAQEATRDFWVPVHKLFSGSECLVGLDLTVKWTSQLFNIKIQRIHKHLKTKPLPTGYPYVLRDKDIADWASGAEFGRGWLQPTQHRALIEPAMLNGKRVTFRVPEDGRSSFAAMEIGSGGPAYVHARTKIEADGRIRDLNDESNVVAAVNLGQYDAQHYVDYTGEGWVGAEIAQLPKLAVVPAFALVAAPDFFPSSGQYELSAWSRSTDVPEPFRGKVWLPDIPPTPLSEIRVPANVQLPGTPFRRSDTSVTAVIGMGEPAHPPSNTLPRQPDTLRASMLPDDAAGIFAPGWDVGQDKDSTGKVHLAGYGLGSPFPEDAKLCAALSTFWPAVAPDIFRTFSTPAVITSGTVAPLTDDEIGQTGNLPWDGLRGPAVVVDNGVRYVELQDFLKADYVQQALENRFSQRLLARVNAEEYKARILALCRVYAVAGNLGDIRVTRQQWLVLSFRRVNASDQELQTAQVQAGSVLHGKIYRVELCAYLPEPQRVVVPGKPRMKRFELRDPRSYFACPDLISVLNKRESDSTWASSPSEA